MSENIATESTDGSPPQSSSPDSLMAPTAQLGTMATLLLFATYMNSNKSDPDSPETLQALSLYREFEQKIVAAKEAHKSMTSLFEERQDAKDLEGRPF
ncbi:hypothetical protein G6F35_017744 [Rhizopus arrhizus]|nr:hypothetical protein G6F35_017744 [Rhizopus arrhizus]